MRQRYQREYLLGIGLKQRMHKQLLWLGMKLSYVQYHVRLELHNKWVFEYP